MAAVNPETPNDVIDAIRPDLEAFASLWSALRTNYEGTNVTKTVARLLHMYQPQDGVLAYERLLRTLYVLLEDFDADGLRLLVSMVPPPKGADDRAIQQVFRRATGFVRINAPIFHRGNGNGFVPTSDFGVNEPVDRNSSTSRLVETSVTNSQSVKSDITDITDKLEESQFSPPCSENSSKSGKSPQVIPPDSDLFRGFPPNEITNTQSHVQNINHLYRPADRGFASQAYPGVGQGGTHVGSHQESSAGNPILPANCTLKWFQTPYFLQKHTYQAVAHPRQDFFLRTADDKYLKVPITKLNSLQPSEGLCTSQSSFRMLYTSSQEYFRNKKKTATGSAFDGIQRLRDEREIIPSKRVPFNEKDHCRLSFDRENTPGSKIASASVPNGIVLQPAVHSELDTVKLENQTWKSTAAVQNPSPKIRTSYRCEKVIGNTYSASEEKDSCNKETLKHIEEEVKKRQRAIQEDIYKMDVVRSNEDIPVAEVMQPIEKSDLTVRKELRTCIQNFLRRAENEEFLEIKTYPKTRSLDKIHQTVILHRKPLGYERPNIPSQKRKLDPDRNSKLPNSTPEISSAVEANRIETTSAEEVEPGTWMAEKKSSEQPIKMKLQKYPKQRALSMTSPAKKMKLTTGLKVNANVEDPSSDCFAAETELRSANLLRQTASMTELAVYRKKYYDALLSIQRAKAAVASSLATSSVGGTTEYDPYYINYLRQYQMLRQQYLLTGPRYPQQRIFQPGPPGPYGTQNPWIRSNEWRYPTYRQFRFSRHPVATPTCSLNQSNGFDPSPVEVPEPRGCEENAIRTQSKPNPRRRKLEEIVGKLKETEPNAKSN